MMMIYWPVRPVRQTAAAGVAGGFMEETKTESIEIQEYLNLVLKNKWLILACVVAGLFIAVIYNETQTPIYTAQLRFEVRTMPRALLTEYSYVSDWWSKERDLNTHFEVLKSHDIIKRTCTRLRLQEKLDSLAAPESSTRKFLTGLFKSAASSPSARTAGSQSAGEDQQLTALIGSLQGSIAIDPVKDTNLADISVSHPNPQVAFLVANAMVPVYEDFILETRFKEVRDVMNIYTDQLVNLKKSLRESEDRYIAYIQKTGISSMQESKQITLEGLSDLKLNYTDTKIKRAELQTELNALEAISRGDMGVILQAPLLDKNPTLGAMKKEIAANQLQLQDLQKKYRPQHPEVVKKQALLQSMQENFYEELDTYVRNKRAEQDALAAKERELSRAIQENASVAIQDSTVALQYQKYKDELDSNKTLYETLLNKIKELDITKSSRESSIQVVQEASMPGGPVKPRKSVNLTLGLILGLLSGIGLVFARHYLDNTFKNADQIKQTLRLPTLAMIEQIPDKDRAGEGVPLITGKEISRTFTESFRFLKTNLAVATLQKKSFVVMVSSTGAGEGKTTVSINLAVSLAKEGRTTLLLDMDLRRPKVHNAFGITNQRGFTTLMLDPFESVPLAGSIGSIAMADLVDLLIHQEKTGVLQVKSAGSEYRLYLLNGRIAQIDCSDRDLTERLGHLLVNRRLVNPADMQKWLDEAASRRQRIGEFLFARNIIDLPSLVEALQHQFSFALNQLLQVEEGEYRFEALDDLYFHPEILRQLKVEKHLAEYLEGRFLPISDGFERFAIHKTDVEGLYVLPAGPQTSDPDEILASDRVRSMIDLFRRHFQAVVVDSPPTAMVSDSNALSPHVDGIVHVIKYGGLPRKLILNTIERLRANNAKYFGAVLNMVNLRREAYLDEHYYYYYKDYYHRDEES